MAYAFDKPHRLTVDELDAFAEMHRNLAVAIAKELTSFFHTSVGVQLEHAEQTPYVTAVKGLPAVSCFAYLSDHVLLHVDTTVTMAAINAMLGGDKRLPTTFHTFTRLEMALGRKFIQVLVNTLNQAWSLFNTAPFTIDEIRPSPFHHGSSADAPYAIFRLATTLHDNLGVISIAYPLAWLSPFKKEGTATRASKPIAWEEIPLEVIVRLGTASISATELNTLLPGDILKLDTPFNTPLDIVIGSTQTLKGYPGLRGKHKAVSLSTPQ